MSEVYTNMDQAQAGPLVGGGTPWKHGKIARAEVERLMREAGYQEGMFLVRESSKRQGDFVLSVVASARLEHYIISITGNQYRIDDGPIFYSLPELVQYYTHNDDRLPTRLGQYIPNQLAVSQPETYENVWDGTPSDQVKSMSLNRRQQMPLPNAPVQTRPAQPVPQQSATLPPRSSLPPQQPTRIIAEEGGTPYATSAILQQNQPAPVLQQRTPAPAPASVQSKSATLPANRSKFKEIARVKQWIDRGQEIDNVDLKVTEDIPKKKIEGFSADASERADKHMKQFSDAALAEEKMYLMWMNKHLAKVDKSITNLNEDLRNGTHIMEVLKMIAHLPAPFYAKRPTVIQQEVDNWHVVVKFMRKLGIQVDPEGDNHEIGLDPVELHKGDRREMLKLFAKLLLYETMHPRK